MPAAVVICREQRAGAPSINFCGFDDCTFAGPWSVAPVVAYGAEFIQFRNCSMGNNRPGNGTAVLALDSGNLSSFDDGATPPIALSGGFAGHTFSGIHILNCGLVNNGTGTGRTGLRFGDSTSFAYVKGTWIAVPSGDSNIELNGYIPIPTRLRYPRIITLDSATTFADSVPVPAVPVRYTGTALPTEVKFETAPF